ncbi:hypothetical protein BYT27DRAFT_6869810 [Phlegmacium glaucopus]|nr:hypothetical protein BYT27DRAFT_6869810 [Phlegmacium glaucopus]
MNSERASVFIGRMKRSWLLIIRLDVVEAYPYEKFPPEAIVVGDNGKLWMQGRMIGGPVVAGGTAYLGLQVRNHSNKKNSSLTLTLTRTLYLPGQQQLQQPATVQISDTLTTIPFRGPQYIIPRVRKVSPIWSLTGS